MGLVEDEGHLVSIGEGAVNVTEDVIDVPEHVGDLLTVGEDENERADT